MEVLFLMKSIGNKIIYLHYSQCCDKIDLKRGHDDFV